MKTFRNVLFVLTCVLGMVAAHAASSTAAAQAGSCSECTWFTEECRDVSYGEIGGNQCVQPPEWSNCSVGGEACTPGEPV